MPKTNKYPSQSAEQIADLQRRLKNKTDEVARAQASEAAAINARAAIGVETRYTVANLLRSIQSLTAIAKMESRTPELETSMQNIAKHLAKQSAMVLAGEPKLGFLSYRGAVAMLAAFSQRPVQTAMFQADIEAFVAEFIRNPFPATPPDPNTVIATGPAPTEEEVNAMNAPGEPLDNPGEPS